MQNLPDTSPATAGLLTVLALVAFAANSLLCRMALAPPLIDPVSFTSIRLASGAAALVVLVRLLGRRDRVRPEAAGSWLSALALFAYAIAFSLAYIWLSAGVGALVLFGSVQATMIGFGLATGERPGPGQWLGLLAALGGLVYLVLPGSAAPDPTGVALMALSGVAWGAYSLRGRAARAPVASTAGNFVRAAPPALLVTVVWLSRARVEPTGLLLALASGVVTSGLGYVVWYRALRGLTATSAGVVQLVVPVLAAAGGVLFLDETISGRLVLASVLILGGVALAIGARPRRRPSAVAVLALALLLAGCGGGDDPPVLYGDDDAFADPDLDPFKGDLPALRQRRLVRALVTPSRTDFFVDSGRISGIQAEYLRELARHLNRGVRRETEKIRVKFVPVPFNELLPALRAGRGDVAAAFLTVTDERRADVAFTAPFRRSVTEVVVTHRGSASPERVEDLAGRLVYVLRGSSYAEHLRDADRRLRRAGLEPMEIVEADARLRSEDILEFVNAGVVDVTVIDDYKARLWAKVLPDIVVNDGLALEEGNHVAWAVRPDAVELKAAIDRFVRKVREGASLGNVLLNRYFEDVQWLDNPNVRSEQDRLRRYLALFRKYGDRYGFDPLALAAQAYQESGLDPDRRSPAGAVGLMQVLPSTAADPQVAIEAIDTPEGNVHAGTKYLAFLRDRYFADPEISEWDRLALAWASYNAGPRKIMQARDLARTMGLDPDVWFGNVEVATARVVGRQPVRYVANIYRYYVAYRLSWIEERRRREAVRELS